MFGFIGVDALVRKRIEWPIVNTGGEEYKMIYTENDALRMGLVLLLVSILMIFQYFKFAKPFSVKSPIVLCTFSVWILFVFYPVLSSFINNTISKNALLIILGLSNASVSYMFHKKHNMEFNY
jgi:hypothetical protein